VLTRCLLVIGFCWLSVPATRGEQWSRFRGPNGSGIVAEISIPSTWTEEDYAWKRKLPGEGHSSPVFWDERIFRPGSNQGNTLPTKHVNSRRWCAHDSWLLQPDEN